jgi:hypothetical protein
MLTARHDLILQLRVLDERFQLYCSINWCFMHQATIGLFGHVVKSIIYKNEITLRDNCTARGQAKTDNPSTSLASLGLRASASVLLGG